MASNADAGSFVVDSVVRGRVKKTATETLARVRNNQRRHRARRRELTTSLEARLQETERLLEEARAEIKVLKNSSASTERQNTVAGTLERRHSNTNDKPVHRDTNLEELRFLFAEDFTAPFMDIFDVPNSFPVSTIAPNHTAFSSEYSPSSAMLPTNLGLSSPSFGAENAHDEELTTGEMTLGQVSLDTRSECCSDGGIDTTLQEMCLQAPASHGPITEAESTMLCTTAFGLIRRQNLRGMDMSSIRAWLWQGYRQPRDQTGGCRVDSVLLFELLDYISTAR